MQSSTSSAVFIQKKEGDGEIICNICTDPIEDDKIVGLVCDPEKHVFCYDCISSWFKELKNPKKSLHNYYKYKDMCPVCFKAGGVLPKYVPVKCSYILEKKNVQCSRMAYFGGMCKIHGAKEGKKEGDIVLCGTLLKVGKGVCSHKGKEEFGGKCGVHKVKEL